MPHALPTFTPPWDALGLPDPLADVRMDAPVVQALLADIPTWSAAEALAVSDNGTAAGEDAEATAGLTDTGRRVLIARLSPAIDQAFVARQVLDCDAPAIALIGNPALRDAQADRVVELLYHSLGHPDAWTSHYALLGIRRWYAMAPDTVAEHLTPTFVRAMVDLAAASVDLQDIADLAGAIAQAPEIPGAVVTQMIQAALTTSAEDFFDDPPSVSAMSRLARLLAHPGVDATLWETVAAHEDCWPTARFVLAEHPTARRRPLIRVKLLGEDRQASILSALLTDAPIEEVPMLLERLIACCGEDLAFRVFTPEFAARTDLDPALLQPLFDSPYPAVREEALALLTRLSPSAASPTDRAEDLAVDAVPAILAPKVTAPASRRARRAR